MSEGPFAKKPTPPAPTPQPSIEPEPSAADEIAMTRAVTKYLLHPFTLIGAGVLLLAALLASHITITVRAAPSTVAAVARGSGTAAAPVPDTWTLWQAWETGIDTGTSTARSQSKGPLEHGLTRD